MKNIYSTLHKGKWEFELSNTCVVFDYGDIDGMKKFLASQNVNKITCFSAVDFPEEDGGVPSLELEKVGTPDEIIQKILNWPKDYLLISKVDFEFMKKNLKIKNLNIETFNIK